MKLDHVGIVVKDINKAIDLFTKAFGLRTWRPGVIDMPEIGCKSTFLPLGGESIELIEPTDPQSLMGKALETKGEGLFQFTFLVDDLDAEVKSLREKGIVVDDPKSLPAHFPIPSRFTFLSPDSLMGAIIELVEITKKGG